MVKLLLLVPLSSGLKRFLQELVSQGERLERDRRSCGEAELGLLRSALLSTFNVCSAFELISLAMSSSTSGMLWNKRRVKLGK